MASIHKRNGKYAVMYNYVDENGKRRQKWESFKTQAEAMKRKKEVEYKTVIGKLKVQEISTRVMERYYQQLLKTETVTPATGKRRSKYVTPQTIRSIHKLLHSCFEQAVKWELIEKNPTEYASRPKADYNKRDIWTVETLFHRRLPACLPAKRYLELPPLQEFRFLHALPHEPQSVLRWKSSL